MCSACSYDYSQKGSWACYFSRNCWSAIIKTGKRRVCTHPSVTWKVRVWSHSWRTWGCCWRNPRCALAGAWSLFPEHCCLGLKSSPQKGSHLRHWKCKKEKPLYSFIIKRSLNWLALHCRLPWALVSWRWQDKRLNKDSTVFSPGNDGSSLSTTWISHVSGF